MRKLAALFPGIGYHCDKPLLYFSAKAARGLGYQVIPVAYGGFPPNVKGDAEKMRLCAESAFAQSEAILDGAPWQEADDIVFIGKSIGTSVACRFARAHGIPARQLLLTPLVETFDELDAPAAAFHGTADPWADTPTIRRLCAEKGVPLHLTEGANHSLETGDVFFDLQTLAETIRSVEAFLRK